MLAAALLLSMYPDWVPARWPSNDPQSLELLDRTPINCLWLERPLWSSPFATIAARRGVATLGIIRPGADPLEAAALLVKLGFTGAVLEGDFDARTSLALGGILAKARLTAIECVPRSRMRLAGDSPPVVATFQGVWPGIQIGGQHGLDAGPTSATWIDTNAGFLRFARAASDATVWLANRPPPKLVIPLQHYLQSIGDAAMNGARWVLAFDDEFWSRLLRRDKQSLEQWRQIGAGLQHYEDRREWRAARPQRGIAVLEDRATGALLSGGLVDMLAAQHLPVFPVPLSKPGFPDFGKATIVVNTDPSGLQVQHKEALAAFAKSGGIVIDGPARRDAPGVSQGSLPQGSRSQAEQAAFTIDPSGAGWMDEIWKKVDSVTAERNTGVRLFNVASVRVNLLAIPGQKQTLLHLVNYSDYPVQGISVRVLGAFRHARLYRPGKPPLDLDVYQSEEGVGFDIEAPVDTLASIVLE